MRTEGEKSTFGIDLIRFYSASKSGVLTDVSVRVRPPAPSSQPVTAFHQKIRSTFEFANPFDIFIDFTNFLIYEKNVCSVSAAFSVNIFVNY